MDPDSKRDAGDADGPSYHIDYHTNAEDSGTLGSPTRMSHAASVASTSSLSVPAQHFGTPAMGSTRVGALSCTTHAVLQYAHRCE